MPLEKSSDAEHRALKRVVDDLDSRLARCNSMLERAETLMQSKNKELAEKASKKRADLMTAIEDIKKFQLPEARKELGRYEEKMREVDALQQITVMSECQEREYLCHQVEYHERDVDDLERMIYVEANEQREIKDDPSALAASQERIEALQAERDWALGELDKVNRMLTAHLRTHKC
ncbi:hypothetical protein LIA77_11017 [Sarocladium implicatum]|nr:hypothetical protein LIA77_11017 [Sarocladium implicatum]